MAALGHRGTIREFSGFNPQEDAAKLRKAMKGLGTDEDAIIEVLARRTIAQRQQIKLDYKTAFGRDLISDLKSEISGNFEQVVIGLMMTPVMYDVHELKKSIKGAGTDEGCLIEILASRDNEEIQQIIATYRKEFGKSLEDDICGDTSHMFQRVLVSLATGNRDEGNLVDDEQAEKDAKTLYEAGEKQWGTDEVAFLTILCTRNPTHLRRVFEEYKVISKKDIESSIKGEMSGSLENALLAVVKNMKNQPAYFAERLYKSMKGAGTDDNTLIRVMITRCEVDMLDIKQEFQRMYGKSLYSFIKGDCSGDYKKVLLQLCGGE
ncbi:annexin A4-like [Carcharodon carcharias]|uniref:annexin A4-like n=1 Tax=Carcharodon carcharias TaxID=13397 RepID=UPI001B7F53BB|nr:annexin A4-like [Carcharodon carcharias]XP_041065707.1 annexin A4-like [Carcharodon carcharias]XP_041065708.1 annexin A4-like [Carcharodon carcharias]XP_041065709.1 annexin A4-like [Carcharodon carcharias]